MDLVENRQDIGLKRAEEFTLGWGEVASLVYHDIFDYPLSLGELIKWRAGDKLIIDNEKLTISYKNGFYFFKGKEGIVLKRLLRERISARKLEIARKAGRILGLIPTIKMVAVTGALAMGNAGEDSDIDLLIVTKKGTLWTTRLITLLLLDVIRFPRRKFGDRNQKDKLCLNIWLDESDLKWPKKDRNVYTSHEIAQVVPLADKEKTYERFIYLNKWIKDFWPNHPARRNYSSSVAGGQSLITILEPLARELQFIYMRKKITREVVTKTRALFHPHDWGKVVLSRLAS
ncbi:MAG: nucleotidyltransferase domain-containing protein [Patescibacteria group bacterium]|mgnify:CR=1 FL=1